jgi:hypothetical protein
MPLPEAGHASEARQLVRWGARGRRCCICALHMRRCAVLQAVCCFGRLHVARAETAPLEHHPLLT